MSDDAVPVQDSGTTVEAKLPKKHEVAFRVCWGESADRATGSVVILRPSGNATIPGTPFALDEDGDLDVELEAGEWSCTAIHPDGRQLKPTPLKIPNDLPGHGKKVVLRLYSLTRDISQTWGRWTFAILIAMLAILIGAWIESHRRHPDPAVPSRASAMLDAAARLRAALAEADDPRESEDLLASIKTLDSLLDSSGLRGDLKKRLDETAQQKFRTLMAVEEEMSDDTLVRLLLEKIAALENALPALATAEFEASEGTAGSTLWSKPPKLYLEILFWATAGILVQLIITIAGYLRRNIFIKNGIYLHAALLITVPLLTLVFVQIISMGRLTADDSTVVLNLSDPRIVAGAAFLIALVPWGLWDRTRAAGRKVLGDNGDTG